MIQQFIVFILLGMAFLCGLILIILLATHTLQEIMRLRNMRPPKFIKRTRKPW